MAIVAGLLGLTFAALHAAGLPSMLRSDRIPRWASLLWLVSVAAVAVGSVALLVSATTGALACIAGGVGGLLALAVLNGTWLHGAPTWSHHTVRLVLGLFVLVLAALSLD